MLDILGRFQSLWKAGVRPKEQKHRNPISPTLALEAGRQGAPGLLGNGDSEVLGEGQPGTQGSAFSHWVSPGQVPGSTCPRSEGPGGGWPAPR